MRRSLTQSLSGDSSASDLTDGVAPVEHNAAALANTMTQATRPASHAAMSTTGATSQHPPAYSGPIRKLTVEQAQAAIAAMLGNLNGWTEFPDDFTEREESLTPDEVKQEAWYTRDETEHVLIDQYGLFLNDDLNPKQLPSVDKGEIVALYAGKIFRTEDELSDEYKRHTEHHVDSYLMVVPDHEDMPAGKTRYISAFKGGNKGPCANTAIKWNKRKKAYVFDFPPPQERGFKRFKINAIYMPFKIAITDKNKIEREETVFAILGYNLQAGCEIRVEYGDEYLQLFPEPPSK